MTSPSKIADQDKLTAAECRQWINDLHSGEYRQCKGRLKTKNQYGEYYCCLGVLETTQDKPRNGQFVLSERVLSPESQRTLAHLNDIGTSFADIAEFIEARILPDLESKESRKRA